MLARYFILLTIFTNLSFADGNQQYCPTGECSLKEMQGDLFINITDIMIKDCSCKADAPGSTVLKEAEALEKVCQCYNSQLPNNALVRAVYDPQANEEAFQGIMANKRANNKSMVLNVLGFVKYGYQIQANNLGGNVFRNVQTRITEHDGHDSEVENQLAQNLTVARLSDNNVVNTSLKNDLNSTQVNAILQEKLSDENCVTMKDYLDSKSIPVDEKPGDFNENFYKKLSTEEWKKDNWNINSLRKQLEDVASRVDDKYAIESNNEAKEIKARMHFLFANPLYLTLFSSRKADDSVQKRLFENIKNNYAPSNCRLPIRTECALNNRSEIKKSDRNFFSDPEISQALADSSDEGVHDYINEVNTDLDLYRDGDYTPPEVSTGIVKAFTGEAESVVPSLRDPLTNESANVVYRPANVFLQCGLLKNFRTKFSTNNFNSGDFEVLKYTKTLASEFDLNPSTNKEFIEFKNRACTEKRCLKTEVKSNGLNNVCEKMVSWKDFLANKNCMTKIDDKKETCLQQSRKDYFCSHKFSKPSDSFLNLLGSVSEDPTASSVCRVAKDPPPLSEHSSDSQLSSSAGVTTTPSTDFSISQNGNIQSISRYSDISRTDRYTSLADLRSSVSSNSTPTVSSPVVESSRSADIPIGSTGSQNRVASAPTYIPYLSSPIAPIDIPQVTAAAQTARTESNQLESQANAIASARAVATDVATKNSLDAQLAALTDRANAADAKASSLEAQLKAAERLTRAPASTASTVAPVTGDSGSSTSGRTNVASNISNPVSAPVTVPQIQPQASSGNVQNFGSGGSSINIPISSSATTSSSGRRSNATNFSFKYGSDAKIADGSNGQPSIIVAGNSSSFEATRDFAAAVDKSTSVNIGSEITAADSLLLTNKDLPTISRYLSQYSQTIQPGTIVRLNYSSPGQPAQELIVAKDTRGHLFFPAVRRLAQMRAALTASTGN